MPSLDRHNTLNRPMSTLLLLIFTVSSFNSYQACLSPKGLPGECINIINCSSVMQLLVERPPMWVYDRLKQFICGFDGDTAKICCDITPSFKQFEPNESLTPTTVIKTDEPPSLDSHPNFKLLNHDICGQMMPQPRIFGGTESRLFEFPWMAHLGYVDMNKKQYYRRVEFLCAGTIINKKYILTAAHCVYNLRINLKLFSVRVGEYDLTKEIDCENYDDGAFNVCADKHQDFSFEKFHVHPSYSSTSLQNDIALLRINGTMKFEVTVDKPKSVSPICLTLKSWSEADRYGELAQVTGWGWTENGNLYQGKLRKVNVPVVSIDKCAKTFRDLMFIKLWKKQLCAGGIKGQDSCVGDSGGPLQAVARHMGKLKIVQFGIVSFGKRNCAQVNKPGVYTSVAHYLQWILDTIYE